MNYQIDHDLHCHSHLSLCSGDPEMNPRTILSHAQQEGYVMQAITDHYWDEALPGANNWYAAQDTAHIRSDLPLPGDTGDVKLLFGCETELRHDGVVGISREKMEDYDFIVIPPNHLHIRDMTNPGLEHTAENLAEYFTRRLELLTGLDLPWHKVGIAHLNFIYDGDASRHALDLMDPDRLLPVFRDLAGKGVGIELNSACFEEDPAGWETVADSHLRLFYMARDAGCKFYCCSDCHKYSLLTDPAHSLETVLRPVIDRLELTEDDKFRPQLRSPGC